MDTKDLKTMRKMVNEFKKRKDIPSLHSMLSEIKDLMQEFVAMQYLEKLNDLKKLLKTKAETSEKDEMKKEAQGEVFDAQIDDYSDKSATKFQEAIEILKKITTFTDGKLMLYRVCEDTELEAAKVDITPYYDSSKLGDSGMETVWVLTELAAQARRQKKSPFIRCLVPIENIAAFLTPPGLTQTGTETEDKWKDLVELKVSPGRFEIFETYMGDF